MATTVVRGLVAFEFRWDDGEDEPALDVAVPVLEPTTAGEWHTCRLAPYSGEVASCGMPDCDCTAWEHDGVFDAHGFWWCNEHAPEGAPFPAPAPRTEIVPPAPEGEIEAVVVPPPYVGPDIVATSVETVRPGRTVA